MRLSRKTDYALRVLFFLTERMGHGPVSMTTIAAENEVPRKFLEHIMLDLKTQGWVKSSTGRSGGYVLAASPNRITLGQVVRHFDGILAPVACVSPSGFQGCSQSTKCRFRRVLLEVRNLTAAYLDNATIAEVAAHDPVMDPEVFHLQLATGDGI